MNNLKCSLGRDIRSVAALILLAIGVTLTSPRVAFGQSEAPSNIEPSPIEDFQVDPQVDPQGQSGPEQTPSGQQGEQVRPEGALPQETLPQEEASGGKEGGRGPTPEQVEALERQRPLNAPDGPGPVQGQPMQGQSMQGQAPSVDSSEQEYYPGAVPGHYPGGTPPHEELVRAASEYRDGAEPAVLENGSVMHVPYQKVIPTVHSAPTFFTLVELAPGEYVVDKFLADPMRWNVEVGSSGTSSQFTQVVSINPLECGPMTTDLALTTNTGRIYRLSLEAVECDLAAGEYPDPEEYTKHVRFWYPDGTVEGRQFIRSRQEVPRQVRYQQQSLGQAKAMQSFSGRQAASMGASMGAAGSESGGAGAPFGFQGSAESVALLDLRNMNTDYEIDTDRRFPCEPKVVADDGERTYIRFPQDKPLCSKTYPLYVESPDRQLQLTNYSVYGSTYVVEGVPMKLVVLYRERSGREQRVEIINREKHRAFRRDRRR